MGNFFKMYAHLVFKKKHLLTTLGLTCGCSGFSLLLGLFLYLQPAGATLLWWCSGLLIVMASGICRAWALESRAAVVAPRALGNQLSSCGAQIWLLHSTWVFPGQGIKLMSPAWAGSLALSHRSP